MFLRKFILPFLTFLVLFTLMTYWIIGDSLTKTLFIGSVSASIFVILSHFNKPKNNDDA